MDEDKCKAIAPTLTLGALRVAAMRTSQPKKLQKRFFTPPLRDVIFTCRGGRTGFNVSVPPGSSGTRGYSG